MSEVSRTTNFIRQFIDADLGAGKNDGKVVTRFPPEPNGYLHIGHAKSICLNFGIAHDYGGRCHLRFDDTNPSKEDVEYVESIQEDIRWLGFDWGPHLYHAADYFERLWEWAEKLIRDGKAYIDDQTADQIHDTRGTLTEGGSESPCRTRTPEENLDLFRRMRAGEFPDGSKVLRAKIDMSSPNPNLRDPVMYRIRKESHHRTGDKWCVYPMYDWAHGQSDAIEGITHSICTLEFEAHRPLYDWFLDQLALGGTRPRQIEFARLNLTYTVMSKRMLSQLVKDGHVDGWDDPRMPTIAGLRRRGYTPSAIREFANRIGVAKGDSVVDLGMLEDCLRDDLNPTVRRVMCVHKPLKVVLENFPEGKVEEVDGPYFPDDPPKMGSRKIPFSRVLYVEQDDFVESPPKKFTRLSPGKEVRLRWCYVVKCTGVVKDGEGRVTELRCTYDPDTLAAPPKDGRKIGSAIHWVSAEQCVPVTLRLYDRLFTVLNPASGGQDFKANLNSASLETLTGARAERSVGEAQPGYRVQFERRGFYFADPHDSRHGALVFNRIVPLRDSWAKIAKAGAGK
jgi:glutaminyl-tRNA synthetase